MICCTFSNSDEDDEDNHIDKFKAKKGDLKRKLNIKHTDPNMPKKITFTQFNHHVTMGEFIKHFKSDKTFKYYQTHEIASWFENQDSLGVVEKGLLSIIQRHIEIPKVLQGDSVQKLIASAYEKLVNEQKSESKPNQGEANQSQVIH